MTNRREAREYIVQLLFQMDMNPAPPDEVFEEFWVDKNAHTRTRDFVETTVQGVLAELSRIDGIIQKYAMNWEINRMGIVDRNVMRMAIYEMDRYPDIPPVVSVNEAVDLAKYFSSNESSRFVNGILDRVLRHLDRPLRTGAKQE